MQRVNRFGTSSDMVIQEVVENGEQYLLAIDAMGLYLTTRDRVDRPIADLNRYAGRRAGIDDRLEKLGLSPASLVEEHKDKIKVVGETTMKKINPLKASKRGIR